MPISPLVLERTIVLEDSRLNFYYVAANDSDLPFQFIWAFHPLMTFQDGDEIQLPLSCKSILIDTAINCALGKRGDRKPWPYQDPETDLRLGRFGAIGSGLKFYTDPLNEGWAAIYNSRTKERLQFDFDVQQIDTVGVWINRGGWLNAHHVAIEPALGAPDPLDVAVRDWGRYAEIEPKGSLHWNFRMQIN
jgi:hypothetical protein